MSSVKPPSPNEGIKANSRFLRGTIAEGLQQIETGALSDDDQQLTKFHGIYVQDDRDLHEAVENIYALDAPQRRLFTLANILRAVQEDEPVSLRVLNPEIPRDLETICLKCLEKEPARRYATAKERGDELGRFLNNEPLPRPIPRGLRGS